MKTTSRGFTLLELALFFSIAAIAAAIILPDVIQSSRVDMARKAAEDMARLQDAAKWYFVHSSSTKGQEVWPGEAGPNECTGGVDRPVPDLQTAGYLPPPPERMLNPWGERYELDLVVEDDSGDRDEDCFFRVGTKVPRSVVGTILEMSPYSGRAVEDADEEMTPDGYTWVSTSIRKPGLEAGFDD
jgi:type II secretory pathway pseudopilin PulG